MGHTPRPNHESSIVLDCTKASRGVPSSGDSEGLRSSGGGKVHGQIASCAAGRVLQRDQRKIVVHGRRGVACLHTIPTHIVHA